LIEIVAVVSIGHSSVSSHGHLNASLIGSFEPIYVAFNRRFGLSHNVGTNPCFCAMLDNISNGCRRRNEVGSPFEHHLDALIVDQVAMLDGVDTGSDGILDRGRTMSMRAGRLSGSVSFLYRGSHFL